MLRSTIVLLCCLAYCSSSVVEFSDKFVQDSKHGEWMVMFYAPWCGHCKHMMPAWVELGTRLKNDNINVGRLDCTKYSNVAQLFGVRGFPTVKYIRDGIAVDYNGPRNVPSLVSFVEKASGPPVEKITNKGELSEKIAKNSVVFAYIGTDIDSLWNSFEKVAKTLYTELSFISVHSNLVDVELKNEPSIVVFKDDTYYQLSPKVKTADGIKLWVLIERLPSYLILEGSTYSKLKSTGRRMAIAVFDSKGDNINSTMGRIALKRKLPFAFCWTVGTSLVDRIVYSKVKSPNVVVFDPKQQTYALLFNNDDVASDDVSEDDVEKFLSDVKDNKVTWLGGMGIWQQFTRMLSDIFMTFVKFFEESPILASLVVVIPTTVVIGLCVCICIANDDDDVTNEDWTDSEEDMDPPVYDQEQPSIEGDGEGLRRRNVAAEEVED